MSTAGNAVLALGAGEGSHTSPVPGLRVGIDVGGTKTEVVLVSPDGRIVDRVTAPSGEGPEGVVARVVDLVSGLLDRSGLETTDVEAYGVGIPGQVSVPTGVVRNAVNLGVTRLPLKDELEGRLGRPVAVENDVNATALGAYRELSLGAEDSLAYVNFGTGLAAGVVLGGRLWRGATGGAGEIGHIPLTTNSRPCKCGQVGCAELTASGVGLRHPESARDELDAAIAGVLRSLVLTLDVQTLAVGGGVITHSPGIVDAVRAVLRDWTEESPLLQSYAIGERLVTVPEDRPVAALGAALLTVSRR